MKERDTFDFWYAVNNTEILRMPSNPLETFGSTVLHYHLVSELMDTVDRVRVREGRMHASQPKIITPEAYSETLLEGFGDEAERYMEWLREHENDVRILQYGYQLKQESFSEHVISDKMQTVVERVENEVKDSGDPMSAVIVGVDNPWDVCLVKLFWEVIQNSAKTNITELSQRRMFDKVGGIPMPVHQEIEAAFLAASRDSSQINSLASLLQRHRLFEQYQDRFFALVKASRRG